MGGGDHSDKMSNPSTELVDGAEQPASFPFQGSSMFKDATLRQTLHLSIDVERRGRGMSARWPHLVLAKLQKSGGTNIAVNDQAAGGNTVLTGGLGPVLMQRYQRDLLQTAGVKHAIIFEGVNDIGGGSTDSDTQVGLLGDQLISSFKQIAIDAHKAGIKSSVPRLRRLVEMGRATVIPQEMRPGSG
ncbi:lipolytic enzyme [Seiridium cupressi]